MAWVSIGDDLDACRDAIRTLMALYVGAFGTKGTNVYHALVARCGYEAEAARIQELALAGKRAEAAAAVPDRLVDEFALVGTVTQVADRLHAYRDAGVTTLLVQTTDMHTIRAVAEAAELGGVT
jgi:alkanesulfonate monooxygenase SsuD/methylene tetrahydromethanopterin reductase-like flavin-dependent oxidoreductase (luciferase family)